jgi:hypothetical protein
MLLSIHSVRCIDTRTNWFSLSRGRLMSWFDETVLLSGYGRQRSYLFCKFNMFSEEHGRVTLFWSTSLVAQLGQDSRTLLVSRRSDLQHNSLSHYVQDSSRLHQMLQASPFLCAHSWRLHRKFAFTRWISSWKNGKQPFGCFPSLLQLYNNLVRRRFALWLYVGSMCFS